MLLFDENLAVRLAAELADLYPDCAHVAERGLAGRPDHAIWEFARTHAFVIVTKGEDFQRLSVLFWSAAESDMDSAGELLDSGHHPLASRPP